MVKLIRREFNGFFTICVAGTLVCGHNQTNFLFKNMLFYNLTLLKSSSFHMGRFLEMCMKYFRSKGKAFKNKAKIRNQQESFSENNIFFHKVKFASEEMTVFSCINSKIKNDLIPFLSENTHMIKKKKKKSSHRRCSVKKVFAEIS